MADMVHQNLFCGEITVEKADKNYVKSINKAMLEDHCEDGHFDDSELPWRSDLRGDRLNTPAVEKYFTGTPSRVEGIGIEILARESLSRHHKDYPDERTSNPLLDVGGQYQWRREGEYHLFNPETVAKLQVAVRQDSFKTFRGILGADQQSEQEPLHSARSFEIQEGQSDSD